MRRLSAPRTGRLRPAPRQLGPAWQTRSPGTEPGVRRSRRSARETSTADSGSPAARRRSGRRERPEAPATARVAAGQGGGGGGTSPGWRSTVSWLAGGWRPREWRLAGLQAKEKWRGDGRGVVENDLGSWAFLVSRVVTIAGGSYRSFALWPSGCYPYCALHLRNANASTNYYHGHKYSLLSNLYKSFQ